MIGGVLMFKSLNSVIESVTCDELNIEDSFFDSLRDTYGQEFNSWFEKCADTRRDAFAIRENGKVYALCIYKVEHNEAVNDDGWNPCETKLKICTFKVSSEVRGVKYGEKLLAAVFQLCREKKIPFVYLTTGNIQRSLIDLLESFGFFSNGCQTVRGRETPDDVYAKWTIPSFTGLKKLEKAEFLKRFYPSYLDDVKVNKYLVPIQKEWHEKLFPEISYFADSLFGAHLDFQESEGNTIRKVYICKANISSIEPGDLLYFYRSEDRHSVEAYGAVDAVIRSTDLTEIMEIVEGRTVYTKEKLREILISAKNGLLVLRFVVLGYIKPEVTSEMMKNHGVPIPQTISTIDADSYETLFKQNQLWPLS